jgi:hypothetical protein
MIAGVSDEIMRLEYTIEACEIKNPHGLDIDFMKKCLAALIVYRDLHRS